MNALQYESDEDFYNSRLTREQLLANAIIEAEAPTDILEEFWELYAAFYGVEPVESKVNSYALEYSTDYFEWLEGI